MELEEFDFSKIEKLILGNVKFMNHCLEETRKRNEVLKEELKTTYGKLIGLGTPYEEFICIARKVKVEFDKYLSIVREYLLQQMRKEELVFRKSKRRKK